ncbi:MAG: YgaP family membrane protein [Anaerolineae bacterium]
MRPNVGGRDQLLRTILGVYAMLLGFLFIQGVVGIIVGALGLVSLVTGITGYCGIYMLLGISTRSEEDEVPTAQTDASAAEEAATAIQSDVPGEMEQPTEAEDNDDAA